MTQLTNFQYGQLSETLELLHTISQSTYKAFVSIIQLEFTMKNTKQFVDKYL